MSQSIVDNHIHNIQHFVHEYSEEIHLNDEEEFLFFSHMEERHTWKKFSNEF